MSDQLVPLPPPGAESDEHRQSNLAEISRQMVRLYKEHFGRGPTKARTDFAGPDIVVCTLEKSLTPAEQKLASLGEHQRLRDTRMYFQYVTREDFAAIVEGILRRRVRAFVSGLDAENDVATEVFYLEQTIGPHLDGDGDGHGPLDGDGNG